MLHVRWRVPVGATAAFFVAVALTGCTTPSSGDEDFQQKVATTADAMSSAVGSAQLGVRAWQRGQLTESYADTVVTNAERDAESVIAALDSRQPPDERSIRLKDQADQPLQDASNALTDLRIALRRDDRAGVGHALDDLRQPMQELARLGDLKHGG
ncbi:MAG TPA: hypothetical protein VFX33_14750 [Actinomycetales bacterium]|nr:hypothetical protein [Actinomycetales bacterium]